MVMMMRRQAAGAARCFGKACPAVLAWTTTRTAVTQHHPCLVAPERHPSSLLALAVGQDELVTCVCRLRPGRRVERPLRAQTPAVRLGVPAAHPLLLASTPASWVPPVVVVVAAVVVVQVVLLALLLLLEQQVWVLGLSWSLVAQVQRVPELCLSRWAS